MILLLFSFFVILSLTLIVIGLVKPEESAQTLIGFLFLFILSFVLMDDALTYKGGEETEITYFYAGSDINYTLEVTTNTYIPFNETDGDRGLITTHNFGYWLAIASFLGFIMVIFGLTGGFRRGE